MYARAGGPPNTPAGAPRIGHPLRPGGALGLPCPAARVPRLALMSERDALCLAYLGERKRFIAQQRRREGLGGGGLQKQPQAGERPAERIYRQLHTLLLLQSIDRSTGAHHPLLFLRGECAQVRLCSGERHGRGGGARATRYTLGRCDSHELSRTHRPGGARLGGVLSAWLSRPCFPRAELSAVLVPKLESRFGAPAPYPPD